MALIGNYSVYDKQPLKYIGGANAITAIHAGNRGNFSQSGRVRSRMMQDQTTTALEYYALPNGAYPSLTWFIPQQAGQIGSSNQIYGLGSIVASLAGARNATADLTGSGTVTNAFLSLIADLIASLTGAGDISPPPNLLALLNLSGDLTGAGAITAVLNAFASVQADLSGTGTLTLTPYAIGELSADITGESTLSPQNLAAAVWSALAAQYNDPNTMGELLNSAGTAADPLLGIVEGTLTLRDVMRLLLAVNAGDATGLEGSTMVFRSVDGATIRVQASYTTGTRDVTTLNPT
jgi:hypothetical protein